jgi:hypothetical protein
MSMTGSNSATARLRDLERTVNTLNGQLRDMQSELQQQSKGSSNPGKATCICQPSAIVGFVQISR